MQIKITIEMDGFLSSGLSAHYERLASFLNTEWFKEHYLFSVIIGMLNTLALSAYN